MQKCSYTAVSVAAVQLITHCYTRDTARAARTPPGPRQRRCRAARAPRLARRGRASSSNLELLACVGAARGSREVVAKDVSRSCGFSSASCAFRGLLSSFSLCWLVDGCLGLACAGFAGWIGLAFQLQDESVSVDSSLQSTIHTWR